MKLDINLLGSLRHPLQDSPLSLVHAFPHRVRQPNDCRRMGVVALSLGRVRVSSGLSLNSLTVSASVGLLLLCDEVTVSFCASVTLCAGLWD